MEDVLNPPEAAEKAQEIADRAVTLVRNNGGAVPLSAPEKACYVVMQESRSSSSGQVFTQELKNRHANARVATIDPTMPRPLLDETMAKLGACDNYAVAAFATVGAYRGSVGLAGDLTAVMQAMTSSGKPVVLVALGNPYLLRNFPEVTAYLATFSSVPVSELAALKALLGEVPIRGRLPVTIPGLANYGDGIQLPARVN
jgi:beta-N-acetylhexosaminidase